MQFATLAFTNNNIARKSNGREMNEKVLMEIIFQCKDSKWTNKKSEIAIPGENEYKIADFSHFSLSRKDQHLLWLYQSSINLVLNITIMALSKTTKIQSMQSTIRWLRSVSDVWTYGEEFALHDKSCKVCRTLPSNSMKTRRTILGLEPNIKNSDIFNSS